ncbi:hypothetical protein DV735_g5295, partial [Chaetothyriales sp. CBS 134920]
MGTYLFKWPYSGANEVYVSGTFDDWGQTAKLDKVGEVFEKEIELPSATEKILYKFVVDNEWKLDEAAPKEDDGHFNVNNVLFPAQIKAKAAHASNTSHSSTGVIAGAAAVGSAAVVGAGAALAAGVSKVGDLKSAVPTSSIFSSTAPESTTAALAADVPKGGDSAPTTSAISSAAPESTTAALAGGVSREVESAPVASTISSVAPESTTAALAGGVSKVQESVPTLSGVAPESTSAALAAGVSKVDESARGISTFSSAAPESTTAALAAGVPKLSDSAPTSRAISSAAPESSTAALAAGIPKVGESAPTTSVTAPPGTTGGLAVDEDVEKTRSLPGGFPVTPAAEPDSFSVSPIPASTGTGNLDSAPVHDAVTTSREDYEKAGEEGQKIFGVAPIPASTSIGNPRAGEAQASSVSETVTTSKEAYEQAGQEGQQILGVAPIPASASIGNPKAGQVQASSVSDTVTTSKEAYERAGQEADQSFGVAPIAASSSIGNPKAGDVQASSINDTVTTSKEAYEQAGQEAEQSFGVAPIAASTGLGNPKAGEVQASSVTDTVTTSKEAYEKAGQEAEQSFGIAPIAATTSLGNPRAGDVQASSINDTVTTSKEAYEQAGQQAEQSFGVAPIAASTGLGNPKDGDVRVSSVNDTVTTSKEDYEKAGTSSLPIIGGVAAVTAGIGAAGAAVFASNSNKKNLIPESSLPLGEDAGKAVDIGPTLSSAAPQSTTASLAAAVPLQNKRQGVVIDAADAPSTEIKEEVKAVDDELLSKVKRSEATGEPASAAKDQTSYYGLPTSVPKTVEESEKAAHASPEASASAAAVHEKSQVERELLEKVPRTDDTDAGPASSKSAAALASDGAADQPLANEPAVQYIQQNDAATASAPPIDTTSPVAAGQKTVEPQTPRKSAPEQSAASTAAKVVSTPQKTVESVTGSPADSAATKDKKKRHRISAFLKKIFD